MSVAMQGVMSLEGKNISKYFYSKWGFLNSSKRLADIIYKISGKKYKAVAFKEWKFVFKKMLSTGEVL